MCYSLTSYWTNVPVKAVIAYYRPIMLYPRTIFEKKSSAGICAICRHGVCSTTPANVAWSGATWSGDCGSCPEPRSKPAVSLPVRMLTVCGIVMFIPPPLTAIPSEIRRRFFDHSVSSC